MSDYYSNKDPSKAGHYDTYETGSGAGIFWALVVVVAFVGLIALGASGGGGGDGAAPVAPAVAPEVAPATAPTATIE